MPETFTAPATPAADALLRELEPLLTTPDAYPRLVAQWEALLAALAARKSKIAAETRAGVVVRRPTPPGEAAAVEQAWRLACWLRTNLIAALPTIVADLYRITAAPRPVTRPLVLYLDEDRYPCLMSAGRVGPTRDGHDYVVEGAVVGVDLGIDESVTVAPPQYATRRATPAGVDLVWYWPRVPDLFADAYTWADCPDELLETSWPVEGPALAGLSQPAWFVASYAETHRALIDRAVGFGELAERVPVETGAGKDHRGRMRAIAARYAAHAERWAPHGDALVTAWRTEYETAWAALSVLLTDTPITGKDLTMPALVATPAAISSLAAQIRAALDAGHGGRLSVSPDAEQAFSWAGTPRTLVAHLNTAQADTRRFTVAIAKDSADVVAPVPEGGQKPNLVTFTSEDLDMLKFAGSAELSVESAQFVANIEAATTQVMVGRLLRAIEAEAAGVIIADAGVQITAATDITAGVISAIAGIAGNGGTATVVGLSAADWVSIMTATGGGNGYVNFDSAEAGPGGTWLGLVPVLVPGLPAETSVVLDGSAVTVFEVGGGPLAIVDPYTKAGTNQIAIYLETWAKSAVTSPGLVASVVTVP